MNLGNRTECYIKQTIQMFAQGRFHKAYFYLGTPRSYVLLRLLQVWSCEVEREGRCWSTSTVLRNFRSGQWGVFEPKSTVKGIPHFTEKGFPWFPSCTQSLPESSLWKAWPWSKCCAGSHRDKGRDAGKCREREEDSRAGWGWGLGREWRPACGTTQL